MAIDRQYSRMVVSCDAVGCEAQIGSERGDDFDTFWSAAKRHGWKARKIGEGPRAEWLHFCGDHDK